MPKYFATPETVLPRQTHVIEIPGHTVGKLTNAVYPEVELSHEAFNELCSGSGIRGLDLEFNQPHPYQYQPTIVAVTTDTRIASVPADADAKYILAQAFKRNDIQWVAHSGISADKPVIEQWLGIQTPLDIWDDSMLTHYLCNQELTKAPTKDDTEDSGALGFMNLWTMFSLVSDMWNWKTCRSLVCDGPCPAHAPLEYCGVDAWAGLVGFQEHQKTMKHYDIPHSLYRGDMELTEICYKMEVQGVCIDTEFVKEAEKLSQKRKELLFPPDGPFNPNSPKQVVRWFKDRGVHLESNSKKDVLQTLENQVGDSIDNIVASTEPLDPTLQQLYNLYEYKTEGKGLEPWFGDRYLTQGLVHPRFITVGTSTGRLSSSRPNLQNVPARGFGELVRRAVIPRDSSLDLIKADFCVSPETKILTSDLRWIEAGVLPVGTELIGFSENLGTKNHSFCSSVVSGTKRIIRPRYKIITDRGEITVAALHPMIVRRKKSSGGDSVRTWINAEDLVIGDELSFTHKPWNTNTSYEAGYVAGILDGEGWLSTNVGYGQQTGSPVLEKTNSIIKSLGISIGGGYSKNKPIIRKVDRKEFKPVENWCTSNTWEAMHLIGTTRPVRLLPKSRRLWEGRRTWGNKTKSAKILDIQFLGDGPVIALETSTGTYISNGFFSHNSNLELRMCVWYTGLDQKVLGPDAFMWLVEQAGDAFFKAAKLYAPRKYADNPKKAARDIAKRVAHAAGYLEGFKLFQPIDLAKPMVKRAIEAGALRVYTRKYMPQLTRDWEFMGGIVGFTGVNLADSLFGEHSFESRKKALEIQEDVYFKNFWFLREKFHMRLLDEAQDKGYFRSATGRVLRLFGSPEDRAKIIAAAAGQGTSADHVRAIMLEYYRNTKTIPLLQVHDELVFEIPKTWSNGKAKEFISLMESETSRVPGFSAPAPPSRGKNWKDLEKF